jgi:hypothetical protein
MLAPGFSAVMRSRPGIPLPSVMRQVPVWETCRIGARNWRFRVNPAVPETRGGAVTCSDRSV